MMPDMDGWQVCSRLREETDVPIIMLTVLGREREIAQGLKLGADEYIVKPWSDRELVARVQAVLRRVGTSATTTWQQTCWCGEVAIDVRRREVTIGGEKIPVTPIEFRLLSYLAKRSGRVVPHGELIAQIWGREFKQDILRLRWHVHNLRQKIERDPAHPQNLLVKCGIGYYCDS
jgi:DNA-binding response OmpR family regulator